MTRLRHVLHVLVGSLLVAAGHAHADDAAGSGANARAPAFQLLHSFQDKVDGKWPLYAGLVQPTTETIFYGTTSEGGKNANCPASGGCGTLFNSLPGWKKLNTITLPAQSDLGQMIKPMSGFAIAGLNFLVAGASAGLYAPCAAGGLVGNAGSNIITEECLIQIDGVYVNGKDVLAPPTLGPDGATLFGVTHGGGPTFDSGVLYSVASNGIYTVLHNFDPATEGAAPAGGVALRADGTLFGALHDGPTGTGTTKGSIYAATLAGQVSIVHTFPAFAGDGQTPVGGLATGSDGTVYGTTSAGGKQGGGVVFSISPAGAYAVLYDFGEKSGDPTAANTAPAGDRRLSLWHDDLRRRQ